MTKEEIIEELKKLWFHEFKDSMDEWYLVSGFLESNLQDLTTEVSRLREALEGLPKHKCRHCNGFGFTPEHANHGHIDGDCDGQCPIQVQCEECHGEGYYVTLDTLSQALTPSK